MLLKSRKTFMAGAASAYSATALLRWPAGAAEFNYKAGNNVPADHPFNTHLSTAIAKIRQESNGQIEVSLFPNSALGSESQMFSQLRLGALEFQILFDGIIADVVPVAALDGVGFAFSTFKATWDAMDGALGSYIRNAIAKIGLFAFERSWDAGFKVMSNSQRPINSPDDLKGLKMRVPPAPMSVSLYKTLGASPVSVQQTEVYTSLQTHLIDGADSTPGTFSTQKFYEIQKYLAITNHSATCDTLLANGAAMQRLPKRLHDIVDRNFNDAAVAERRETAQTTDALQTSLKQKGVIINQPDPEPFRKALQRGGYYTYWRDTLGAGAWAALEKTAGKLS